MLVKPVVISGNNLDKLVLVPVPLAHGPNLFLLDSSEPPPEFVEVPDDAIRGSYWASRRKRDTANSVLLVLNDACNLACSYCFELTGKRTNQELSDCHARQAIDLVLQNAQARAEDAFISFFGGEPTISFRLVSRSIDYARERCAILGLHVKFGITTNGYFGDAICEYLATNFHSLIYSIDGPQQLHDAQRTTVSGDFTFERVFRNAQKLFAALGPERITFRATMTENGISQARVLLDFFEAEFPGASLHLEPALNLSQPAHVISTYRSFCSAFTEMLRNRKTINLQHSHLLFKFKRDASQIDFCGASSANFYITADANVSTCSRVLRTDDPNAKMFFVGHVDKAGVFVETGAADRLEGLTLSNLADCQDCLARYNCKGACPLLRASLQERPESLSDFCDSVRGLTRDYLISCLEAGSNVSFNVANRDV